jgi:pyruvate dehydrogenase E1 component alpha subunit
MFDIPEHRLIDMYESMLRIRLFEEEIVKLVGMGKRLGTVHLYVGEEAVAVGVCANLRNDDYITSTHRGHGHSIAKGTDVKGMMAELFQKKTGTNKGKGGSSSSEEPTK